MHFFLLVGCKKRARTRRNGHAVVKFSFAIFLVKMDGATRHTPIRSKCVINIERKFANFPLSRFTDLPGRLENNFVLILGAYVWVFRFAIPNWQSFIFQSFH